MNISTAHVEQVCIDSSMLGKNIFLSFQSIIFICYLLLTQHSTSTNGPNTARPIGPTQWLNLWTQHSSSTHGPNTVARTMGPT